MLECKYFTFGFSLFTFFCTFAPAFDEAPVRDEGGKDF